MKNLRTHMWLCFTIGVFYLIAMAMMYYVTTEMDQSSINLFLTPELIRTGIINTGIYLIYLLVVLFKAIKYAPSKA